MSVNIEEIKRANPLSALVERLTGQQIVKHKIAAPWRSEATPSLHVYEDGGWYDFGDGVGGDVLDFVGHYLFGTSYDRSAHFTRVIDYLGGLDIAPLPPSKQETAHETSPKPKLALEYDDVCRWHEMMSEQRRNYWYTRGLLDPTIDRFKLGFDGKRYTIPLMYRNKVFGVKRRKSDVDDGIEAKYTMAKGSRAGIFNAEALKTETRIVVCEGEIDCLLLNQSGFPAVCGTTGAGTFKDEWAKLFANVHDVRLLFDNDDAGRAGALKVRQSLRRARIVHLPDGIKDVGELVESYAFPVSWLADNLR